MASNYSEYSRLRSIARKRAQRLAEKGFSSDLYFPTVKELKSRGISGKAATKSVQSFLKAPSTVREAKRATERPVFIPTSSGAVVTTESKEKEARRKAQSRERSRRYRERVRSLSKQEKSYMKAARTLGLRITPANAKAFSEYMDFRFAQGSDSVHYRVARYVEDYMSIIAKKGYSPDEILTDFNQFLDDRASLMDRADDMSGITPDEMDAFWDDFIYSDW